MKLAKFNLQTYEVIKECGLKLEFFSLFKNKTYT